VTASGAAAATRFPVSTVVEACRLEPGGPDVREWRGWFEDALEERIGALARTYPAYTPVAQALDLLAPEVRRAFLRAPAVSSLLLHGDDEPDVCAGLVEGLNMGELVVLGLVPQLPGEVHWSARGDRRVPSAGAEPALGGTNVALDVESPFRFPDDEFGIEGGTVPYDPAELARATALIEESVGVLGAIEPARALVDTFVEVLALRRETGETHGFQSSTFSGLVGLVRLTNAHLDGISATLAGEVLVHEATHGMLYMHEELCEPFVVVESARNASATSPWTGATIALHSLLHACLVWYAIHSYWSGLLAEGACDDAEARTRIAVALRGFKARPAAALLDGQAALMSAGATDLLEQLDAAMVDLV
jgi:hypothetical protein